MQTVFIPLSNKCFFSCLNCKKPHPLSLKSIKKIIETHKQKTLNIISHTTLKTDILKKTLDIIKTHKQKSAIVCHGKHKEILELNPDYFIFPLFSTDRNIHDEFCGKQSFDEIISTFNNLPKTKNKIIVFFPTKETFGECGDLDSLSYALQTKIWIIPLPFFESNEYSKEDIKYLKYLNKYPNLHVTPILRHLKNTTKQCFLSFTEINTYGLIEYINTYLFFKKLFK